MRGTWRLAWAFEAAFVLQAACSSIAAQPGADAGGAGDGGAEAAVQDATVSPSSCADVKQCPRDASVETAIREALAPAVTACGAYCGEATIDFAARCATAVSFVNVGTVEPTTPSQAEACLREAVAGMSWTCAPASGTLRWYIGSCTLPTL